MKISPEEFQQVRDLIQRLCGISLSAQKEYLITSRLGPVLQQFDIESYSELIRRVSRGSAASLVDEIIEAITTKETSFNRDEHPFAELRRSILPLLGKRLEDRKRQSGLSSSRCRIWSVPSSTGQEPYSIAMAIADFMSMNPTVAIQPNSFWILATDISDRALQVAKSGLYSDYEVDRGVTAEQKRKYFLEQNGKWKIADPIRSLVEFQRRNILRAPLISRIRPGLLPKPVDLFRRADEVTCVRKNLSQFGSSGFFGIGCFGAFAA